MSNLIQMFLECLIAAIKSISAHGLRSALTILGIVIGITSVIVVVAIMEGLSTGISKNLDDLGSDMVTLRAYTRVEDQMVGKQNRLTYSDFQMLRGKVDGVEHMTPVMQPLSLSASVQYGRRNTQTQIIGTQSSYQKLVKIFPHQGRFLKESDDSHRRRVAFIGKTVVNKLDMPENPVGEFIKLGGDWFRIIGLAEERGDMFGFDQDNYIMAPFSTIKSLNGANFIDNIMIRFNPSSSANIDQIKNRIIYLLERKYKFDNDDEIRFEFITAEKMRKNFDDITNAITAVAASVVAISLFVGGIGIMNIMLVSVTERTREIGIQKALGATPDIIMLQFMLEALLLSMLGGVIGLLLGMGVAEFLGMIIPGMHDVSLPAWSVWLSFGFTTAIGLIFGVTPAAKAAKLNPIDALSYE